MEINSIFLHFRQLLLSWNTSRRDIIYRINTILNLSKFHFFFVERNSIGIFSVTFLLVRVVLVAYMSIWLILNRSYVPLALCVIGQSGLLMITLINLNLLYRLIKSDFFSI